jgi:hypothetical protein
MLYEERPKVCTRRVFGFCRFPLAFVGNPQLCRKPAYAEGPLGKLRPSLTIEAV